MLSATTRLGHSLTILIRRGPVASKRAIDSTRHMSGLVLSSDKIVSSPHSDVEIPNQALTEFVFQRAHEWPDQIAMTCGASGKIIRYGQLYEIIKNIARELIADDGFGLKKGDVVGVILPNMPETVAAIFGPLEAGLQVTFANPLYTADEITRQFIDANVKVAITLPALLGIHFKLQEKLQGFKGTIQISSDENLEHKLYSFNKIINSQRDLELPRIDPDSVAILPYSSGTTGLPKGVMLSHRNLVGNLCQTRHPGISRYTNPENTDYNEVCLTIPPFFHIYGFNGILNINLLWGNNTVTIPRFTADAILKALITHKPTILFAVPSVLLFLVSHPSVTRKHLESIREVAVGASSANHQLQENFKQKCGHDVRIIHGYGMTESSPVTLVAPYRCPPSKVSAVGQLVPNTQARIVDLEDGKNLGPTKTGELYLKGPQMMLGYLNNEKATKETLDSDGWLHTGDVAYYDEEGFFFIVDRTKELIKVKGNQVSPTELEGLILELKEVSDVAVVGVPDDICGEVPRAYVVLKSNTKLSESTVCDFIKKKVVKYKWLAGGVRFVKSIPRNQAGKIIRNELKASNGNFE